MTCIRCHRRPQHARKLCHACIYQTSRDGTIADYPRATRSRDEVLDDYRILRAAVGLTHREIADRLGMKLASLRQAIYRARSRGDARAAT